MPHALGAGPHACLPTAGAAGEAGRGHPGQAQEPQRCPSDARVCTHMLCAHHGLDAANTRSDSRVRARVKPAHTASWFAGEALKKNALIIFNVATLKAEAEEAVDEPIKLELNVRCENLFQMVTPLSCSLSLLVSISLLCLPAHPPACVVGAGLTLALLWW